MWGQKTGPWRGQNRLKCHVNELFQSFQGNQDKGCKTLEQMFQEHFELQMEIEEEPEEIEDEISQKE